MLAGSRTIGWKEWVALPDLEIPAIKAKIDTGARTSALHAFRLETYRPRRGGLRVRFGIHPLQRRQDIELFCDADVKDHREVKDSSGNISHRYIIQTHICIGSYKKLIEISLARRDTMRFRMLLGRTAFDKNIYIDPLGSYLTGRSLNTSYRKYRKRAL
jgi:hypothetical protein